MRHVWKMREIYGRRRRVLLEGLQFEFGERLQPIATQAGLHISALASTAVDDIESDQQKPVKHRLAWRSSWFSDNVAPRKIIEEIKILGVLADEHTGFFS